MSIQRCLVINRTDLPPNLRECVRDWYNFRCDVLLKAQSEFDGQWQDLNYSALKSYHADQKANNNFTGTLDEFIEGYNLHLEVWLIDNHAESLKKVDSVLIDTSY